MPGTATDYHDVGDRSATYALQDESTHGHNLAGPGDSLSNGTGSGVLSSSIGSYMPPYPSMTSSSSPPTSAYDPTAPGGQSYGSSSDVNAHPTGGALTRSESASDHYNGASEYASQAGGGVGEYEDEYGGPDIMDDPRGLAEEYVEPPPEQDNYVEDVVQPGFDEAILRALCDMDVREPLIISRSGFVFLQRSVDSDSVWFSSNYRLVYRCYWTG